MLGIGMEFRLVVVGWPGGFDVRPFENWMSDCGSQTGKVKDLAERDHASFRTCRQSNKFTMSRAQEERAHTEVREWCKGYEDWHSVREYAQVNQVGLGIVSLKY
jgi:hypothetical protein